MTASFEIPVDAIATVADHCFGENDHASLEAAEGALLDAAPLILVASLRDRAEHFRDLIATETDSMTIALHHVRAQAFDDYANQLADQYC